MEKFLNATGVKHLWQKANAAFVQKDGDKILSSNDFTDELKQKFADIEAGAQVNTIEQIKVGASVISGDTVTKLADITDAVITIASAQAAAAISASGHAKFILANEIPNPDEAEDNVMYLVQSAEDAAKHDIYVRVQSGDTYTMLLIDDTDTDLSGYAKTADVNAALDKKVDKVSGKGLSTNDYTTEEKSKLSGIAEGAQVNIIETVKVNGSALTPANKAIDITVPTAVASLTDASEYAKKSDLATALPDDEILAAILEVDASFVAVS